MMRRQALTAACVAIAAAAGGCASDGGNGSAAASSASAATSHEGSAARFNKPGFVTFVEDGRLWVFREGSAGLAEFRQYGEPAKSITLVGRGPNRMSIRSVDRETAEAYLAAE